MVVVSAPTCGSSTTTRIINWIFFSTVPNIVAAVSTTITLYFCCCCCCCCCGRCCTCCSCNATFRLRLLCLRLFLCNLVFGISHNVFGFLLEFVAPLTQPGGHANQTVLYIARRFQNKAQGANDGKSHHTNHGRGKLVCQRSELCVIAAMLATMGRPIANGVNATKVVRQCNIAEHVECAGRKVRIDINLASRIGRNGVAPDVLPKIWPMIGRWVSL